MTEIEILIGLIGVEIAFASFLYKVFKNFQIELQEEINFKIKINHSNIESTVKTLDKKLSARLSNLEDRFVELHHCLQQRKGER